MHFSFEVFGEQLISRKIYRVGEHAAEAKPVLENVADFMMDIIKGQFTSEGAKGGHRWKALKPETIARKRALGMDRGILRMTERLIKSLTQRGHADQDLTITHSFLHFTTTVPYARRHQRGDPGGHPIPARPFVVFPERDKRDIMKRIQRYVITGEVTA